VGLAASTDDDRLLTPPWPTGREVPVAQAKGRGGPVGGNGEAV
jgi:hypothetical protein